MEEEPGYLAAAAEASYGRQGEEVEEWEAVRWAPGAAAEVL